MEEYNMVYSTRLETKLFPFLCAHLEFGNIKVNTPNGDVEGLSKKCLLGPHTKENYQNLLDKYTMMCSALIYKLHNDSGSASILVPERFKGQAEREFRVEVEAIGRVRHKNLVRLLGYCVEGAYRMLMYEYVDNGNLDQWLHGDVDSVSPLTWDIRMNIILGMAKGLAYLHEGLEPKVVHRDVKSSNILLDRQWNPKVSDFGLAKLLCSDHSYVTTRVMGTFGYVAPEYACTRMLTEKSDVYSFGILIMEIITGRSPADYSKPQGEVNLIEWLKTMVGNRKSEELIDPNLPEKPSSKALKLALLVALKCVDPDATKRPKIGHIIHMLEADEILFRDEQRIGGESSRSHRNYHHHEQKDSSRERKRIGGEIIDQSEDDNSSKILPIPLD
ncbi:probable serine/threonine-protein kinase At1g01540 [Arachis hypogaea]|uniref:probable serine/threonine-protein kinase At1g01540 n=1 Tax=Arachis hypogaea TaxID=3818 RepID=UPI000DECC23D|nr:probable serine/threonine-protein kinase At1g01540 [Arachis hypogaea]